MAFAAGQHAAEQQAAERERHERERGDRIRMHLAVERAGEAAEQSDRDPCDALGGRVGEQCRDHPAEPERLEHAPAEPDVQRPDAVEEHAEQNEQREAPERGDLGATRGPAEAGVLLEKERQRDADQELEDRCREIEGPEHVAVVVRQQPRHAVQEHVHEVRE